MMPTLERLLELLARGPCSSRELQGRLGVSQSTVSRLLRDAGQQVARLGQGRAVCYAGVRQVFGLAASLPLYWVTASGRVEQVALLRALSGGRYLVEGGDLPFWLRGEAGTGLFDSLPYYLYDLRPSGFLGRQLARRAASEWGCPPDPRLWSDDHIGQYLVRRGDDLPGNLIVGEAAAERVNARTVDPIGARRTAYPGLAEAACRDEAPGSSAAGEQPKFAVRHASAGPVIVKFSPRGTSEEAGRWRDLLRAEYHALVSVSKTGIAASAATLHDLGGRLFLEVRRFDRQGPWGRLPALSLTMVDAEFAGQGERWSKVAQALRARELLDDRSWRAIRWLETFGTWIGNTDMHLGNLSLSPVAEGFRLLPVYDMLPMALAPVRGEVPRPSVRPPLRTLENRELWAAAGEAAAAYWSSVADDGRCSMKFRELARALRLQTERALRG